MTTAWRAVGAVARNRELVRLEAAFGLYVLAELGTWLAILVYAFLRGGTTEAGIVAFAILVPAAVLAPFAGAVADRAGGVCALVGGYVAQAATLAATAVAMLAAAPAWASYGLAGASAVALTATRPTQALVTPSLCRSPVELGAVNVLSGWITAAGALAAPAAAGLLLSASQPGAVFLGGAMTTACAAVLARGLHGPPALPGSAVRHALADVVAGIGAVARHRQVRAVTLLLGGLSVVIGAVDVLVVVLAVGELGLGKGGAGYLSAAFGAGGIAGAVLALSLVGRRTLAAHVLAASLSAGLSLVALGIWPTTVAAVGLLAVAGTGRILFDVAARTFLQRTAPSDVLSRTFALAEGLTMAGFATGGLAVPALTAVGGVETALVVVGLLLPAIVVLRWRLLMTLDDAATARVVELALLRSLPMFSLLPPPALEGLARAVVPVTAEEGDDIVVQGEPGDRFYAIADGSVDVIASGRRVTTLDRGEGFGEIALIHGVARTATVRARTHVLLYALEREAFLIAVTGHASTRGATQELADRRIAELQALREETRHERPSQGEASGRAG